MSKVEELAQWGEIEIIVPDPKIGWHGKGVEEGAHLGIVIKTFDGSGFVGWGDNEEDAAARLLRTLAIAYPKGRGAYA